MFQSLFIAPTWSKMQVLLIGALLGRGRRTVGAALRHTGRGDDGHFSSYHQVLNRARWTRLFGGQAFLVISTFGRLDGVVALVIDGTLWSHIDKHSE